MAHELIRIKSKLQNTPHLIDQNTFETVMDYLTSRSADSELPVTEMKSGGGGGGRYADNYNPDTKTGVMYIEGPLSYKPVTIMGFDCGGTSYVSLKEQMEGMVAMGATTVAMLADSGGGEAHGMMDTGNYIRKLADDNGIKLIAYVDGMSASACYGLTCIADEIILSSDSMVGSIGVLIQLYNNSKQLEKEGVERTFITAGKDKVPFAEDGSFTKEFIDRLQGQVDTLYEGFTAHVATHRGMTQDAVKATEANVFLAQESIDLGLADSIMTPEDFWTYLADVAQGSQVSTERKHKFNTDEVTIDMNEAEFKTALALKDEAIAASATQLTALTAAMATQGEELAKAVASLAAIEKAQADASLASRKTQLSAVLAADKVEANLAAFAGLDDASFSVVLGTLQAAKDAVVGGPLMTEAGSEGAETPEPTKPASAHLSTAERIAARIAAERK